MTDVHKMILYVRASRLQVDIEKLRARIQLIVQQSSEPCHLPHN